MTVTKFCSERSSCAMKTLGVFGTLMDMTMLISGLGKTDLLLLLLL